MPRLCSISRLSLAVLLLAVLGSVAWAKPKVAILGLEVASTGVVDPKDAANAAVLTEALRGIPLGGAGKYEIAANSNRELQDEKLMGNCDTEKPTCMAPIGKGLSADFLIYGKIEKAGASYKAELRILNVNTAKAEKPSNSVVPMSIFAGSAGAAKEAAKDWALKVYAELTSDKSLLPPPRVEAGPGKLVIKGNVDSGDVFIGSSKKGRLEDGTITLTLPEGTHELAIEAPGHKRYEATVTVKSGQEKKVDAVLEEMVGPPIVKKSNRMPFKVAGFGFAGVAAGAGVYAAYLWFGPIRGYQSQKKFPQYGPGGENVQHDSDDCDEAALRDPANYMAAAGEDNVNDLYDKACGAIGKFNVTIGVAAVTGALAIGALYFAYRADDRAMEKQTAMGRRKRRQLTVTPVIGPSGGGATVRFDW